MPLNPATLANEILKFSDESNGAFIGFPENDPDMGVKWSAALTVFFSEMVFPPIVAAGLSAAESAMKGALAGASLPGLGIAALPLAIQAYGTAVAALVIPPNIPIPPPAPPVIPPLPPLPIAPPPALAIASAIFAWTKTGLAGPPPNPPAVPWS